MKNTLIYNLSMGFFSLLFCQCRVCAGTGHNYYCACTPIPCHCGIHLSTHITGSGKVGIGVEDWFRVWAHCDKGALGKVVIWTSSDEITCGVFAVTYVVEGHSVAICHNHSVYTHTFNITNISCLKFPYNFD